MFLEKSKLKFFVPSFARFRSGEEWTQAVIESGRVNGSYISVRF